MNADGPLGRRGFLTLGAGLLLTAGCGTSPQSAPSSTPDVRRRTPPSGSAGTTGAPPLPTLPTLPTLPDGMPWQPNSGDIDPDVKRRAARVLEALGTWAAGGAGVARARARVHAAGADPRLADQAHRLLSTAPAATLRVLTAQYGGLLPGSASVLVVCRQWIAAPDAAAHVGGATVDVRLAAASPHWRVTALHLSRPGPSATRPSTLAMRVLNARWIDLPPAARADVLSGRVHDSVLAALLRLSVTYSIGVSVIRSGHPLLVFGTTRLSDHPQGRAFDTYRIDGRLVVDPSTPRALISGYMQAAVAAGSYAVGGPYLPSGSAGPFFTDETHHDHVHAGFAA